MQCTLCFPLSTRRGRMNCPQESGSACGCAAASMQAMERRINSRVKSPTGWLLLFILFMLEFLAGRANAAVVVTPRITFVVYADRTMPEDEWSTLSVSLQNGLEGLAEETHFVSGGFDVVRAEKLAPGAQFDEVIPVYLHGECRVVGKPDKYVVEGTLGWVLRDHGQIRPFIHVDCSRIAEMLGQHAFGLKQEARDAMMAEAVSHVVLHEWVHIATQSRAHARDGIEKPAFTVWDLAPDYAGAYGRASHGK